jgi:flagellar biosynthesis anti-sigma factor FlgM
MKIDTPPINPAGVLETTQPRSAGRSHGDAQTPARTDDAFSVDISAEAGQKAAATAEDDQARREKIAAIRAQLAAGSYSISGKDVAEKILDSIKE